MTRARRVAAFAALSLLSAEASAHGSVQGLGYFFSGVVHPLLEPAHLVSLIAFGLLIGPRLAATRPATACFALATLAGVIAVALHVDVETDTALLVAAALTGLAVVLARPWPRPLYSVAALALGLGIGLGSRPDVPAGAPMLEMLAGSAIGASIWMLNIVALAQAMRRPWMQVLVRIFASWVSAVAILVLALVVSGHPLNAPAAPAAASPGTAIAPGDLRRN